MDVTSEPASNLIYERYLNQSQFMSQLPYIDNAQDVSRSILALLSHSDQVINRFGCEIKSATFCMSKKPLHSQHRCDAGGQNFYDLGAPLIPYQFSTPRSLALIKGTSRLIKNIVAISNQKKRTVSQLSLYHAFIEV